MVEEQPAPHAVYLNFTLPVTGKSIPALMSECGAYKNKGTKEIHLMMSSVGGDTAAGFAAYNFLRLLGIRLVTYNIGTVASIANVLYLAGDERVAGQHTSFMFHSMALELDRASRMDQRWLWDRLQECNDYNSRLAEILTQRGKFETPEEVNWWTRNDHIERPDAMIKKGLVDRVGLPEIPEGAVVATFPWVG